MTDAALGDPSPAVLTRLDRGERSLNALLLMAVLFLMLVPIGSNFLVDPDSQWHVPVGSQIWNSGRLPMVDELSHTFAGSSWIATQSLRRQACNGRRRGAGAAARTAGEPG